MTVPVATLRALYAAHAGFPLHVLENGPPDVPLTVFANELYRILLNSPYGLPRLMLRRIVARLRLGLVAMPPVLLSLVLAAGRTVRHARRPAARDPRAAPDGPEACFFSHGSHRCRRRIGRQTSKVEPAV